MSALLCFRPKKTAALRLVAFPWAGASAAVLRPLSDALKDTAIELHVMAYAGRAHRAQQPLPRSIDDVVDDGIDEVMALGAASPVALYGHSFGAVVAFAVAARVEARGGALAHVVVGARGVSAEDVDLPDDDADLIAGLIDRGFVTRGVFDDVEARALWLPPLRRDLELSKQARVSGSIDADLAVFGGRDDVSVDPAPGGGLDAWAAHSRGAFSRVVVDGGHFFVGTHAAATAAALQRLLQP